MIVGRHLRRPVEHCLTRGKAHIGFCFRALDGPDLSSCERPPANGKYTGTATVRQLPPALCGDELPNTWRERNHAHLRIKAARGRAVTAAPNRERTLTQGTAPAPEPAVTEERKMALQRQRCSKCGKPNHNALTCGRKSPGAGPEPTVRLGGNATGADATSKNGQREAGPSNDAIERLVRATEAFKAAKAELEAAAAGVLRIDHDRSSIVKGLDC